jgi:hypothetical protein
MANQITDNRTLVDNANSVTPYDDLGGTAAGTLDTEIKIQGTGSIGDVIGSTRNGLLYDAGSAQNWSNNVFYIWINCGIVGLLATKASAGFTIRFCGATVTDWFEVYVGGSDSWPPSVAGGWAQFVVDIEDARAAAIVGTVGGVNGTTPATSAIRYVGWSGITGGVMPRMVDNTWMDEIRRLPDGSPGIIIEGRNAGSTDWDSADIATQLGEFTGTFLLTAGGAYKVNTPIQFGINDTTTHGFTDTNAVWLWDDQEFAPSDLYSLSALGNAGGTTNVTFGIKTGTGDAATGAQGLTIAAASTGVRWAMDFDDPNVDLVGLYGCTLIHSGDFQVDDAAVEIISSTILDGTSMTLGAGLFQRSNVVNANTADGVAYMDVSDPTRVKNSSFEFSDGHAMEITSAAGSPWTFTGNQFAGYGADTTTDAAILIDGLTGVLNVGGGGGTPTKREITAGSLTINNNISVTFTGLKDDTEVQVMPNGITGEGNEIARIEDATAGTVDNRTFTWSASAGTVVQYTLHNWDGDTGDPNYETIGPITFTVPTSDTSIPIQQKLDRNAK